MNHFMSTQNEYRELIRHAVHGEVEQFELAVRQTESFRSWNENAEIQSVAAMERLGRLNVQRREIVSSMRPAVWWSLGVMLGSVAVLAMISLVLINPRAAIMTLGTGVVLFGICLWKYWRLIRMLLH